MKKIYSLFVLLLLLNLSYSVYGQHKSDQIFTNIASEVNQDSLTSYVLSLQNLGSRFALADNRKDVSLWIKAKFESFGYQDVILDSFLMSYSGNEYMQYNVVCRSDSTYASDDYLLIGAHHDAITYTTPMDSTPGADDNASGVAGVLETARIMKLYGQENKFPVHFATWAAEELGLLGSEYYVQKHSAENSLPSFYLNLDMIGNSTDGNRKVVFDVTGGKTYLTEQSELYSEMEPVGSGGVSGSSDHFEFYLANVPILYYREYNFSGQYHSDNDRIEYMEMDYMTEVVKGTAVAMYYEANMIPALEMEYFLNAGAGDDFVIKWEENPDATNYVLDVYSEGNLLETIETTDDSLYVNNLPFNQEVCVYLFGVDSSGIAGQKTSQCLQLNEVPAPLVVSTTMNLKDITIQWSDILPLDASSVVIERKRKAESDFTSYDEVAVANGSIEIINHETGIWDYQLKLKDTDGLISESVNAPIYSTAVRDHIMVVSGGDGGYLNPDHTDVLNFYESIMPMKDYFMFSAESDEDYLPILQNMEAVIWNTFSEYYSLFYEQKDLFESYIANGGKLLLFANKPNVHLGAGSVNATSFDVDTWGYSLGIESIMVNDGARLKQLMHTSGVTADVDPDKLYPFLNGSLPEVDALVENENASVVLTYQSLSETSPENDFDDEPIAVKYENGASSVIVCGVPLYYFKEDESKVLLKKLLEDEMMVGSAEIATIDNSVKIYPNPIDNEFHIQNISGEVMSGLVNFTDISGKVIDQFEVNLETGSAQKIQIDVVPGVYFLSSDQLLIQKKLIVE